MSNRVNKIFEGILEDFQDFSVKSEKLIKQQNEKKVYAEFIKWDRTKERIEIKREWIDDIVFAIESQMFVQNKDTGLTIYGAKYCHVDIFEE